MLQGLKNVVNVLVVIVLVRVVVGVNVVVLIPLHLSMWKMLHSVCHVVSIVVDVRLVDVEDVEVSVVVEVNVSVALVVEVIEVRVVVEGCTGTNTIP
mmetsp:Transcript_14402/g.50590  ORF Transcript_14402/g.50590 Transcript_14402/m.50590 type:complete len:97 (-) Transcript_14402:662-952(-)